MKKRTIRRQPPEERFFLITQADVDKIDALIGALNLALGEILENRPVRDHRAEHMTAQREYDRLCALQFYPDADDLDQKRQENFPF